MLVTMATVRANTVTNSVTKRSPAMTSQTTMMNIHDVCLGTRIMHAILNVPSGSTLHWARLLYLEHCSESSVYEARTSLTAAG